MRIPRLPSAVAALALAGLLQAAPRAHAGFVNFLQLAGAGGTVGFAADGSLSGTLNFGPAVGIQGAANNNMLFPATGVRVTFALGPVTGGDRAAGYTYAPGGSLAITGFVNGVAETLYGGATFEASGVAPVAGRVNTFALSGGVLDGGSFAPDLAAFYAIPANSTLSGTFGFSFVSAPGTTFGAPATNQVSVQYSPQAVPEPASWAMVAVGLAWAGSARLRRRRRRPRPSRHQARPPSPTRTRARCLRP